MLGKVFIVSCLLAYLEVTAARRKGYKKFPEPVAEVIKSARPHSYLKASDLPDRWDWRDVNGTNYCGKVLTQQSPNVCGSCWAEAATGALSDRFTIATQGKLRVALAPQALLNFNQLLTGGTCNGGDHLKAYEFAHKHGIADDTCQVFVGMDAAHGFEINEYTQADDIRAHQCYLCEWNGLCGFAPQSVYDVYGADEYGNVLGVDEMKAEIYARGPIACSINSEANAFNYYQGGVIKCDDKLDISCKSPETDHVIIIAGWGFEEATGTPYWVGRNSYGTRWGEGAGGGWFRLELGTNQLNLESNTCSFAVPAQADVDRALKQFASASGY